MGMKKDKKRARWFSIFLMNMASILAFFPAFVKWTFFAYMVSSAFMFYSSRKINDFPLVIHSLVQFVIMGFIVVRMFFLD